MNIYIIHVGVVVANVSLHCSVFTSQDDLWSVKQQRYKRVLFRLDILTKLGDSVAISEALRRRRRRLWPACSSLLVPSLQRNPMFCNGKWVGYDV